MDERIVANLEEQLAELQEENRALMMDKNIKLMNTIQGFDVVIVCTSTPLQAKYWQSRLTLTLGSVTPKSCKVCAVDEDWAPSGAGNGLGTLYAFQKGIVAVKTLYGIDIIAGLQSGELSVGMYHTAGKGTRLAPIPGAENNNKPGVKLPAVISTTSGDQIPLTILEGVIKQTGVYAPSRKGRLSVFWGDQIFVPCNPEGVAYDAKHHADILAQMGPMASEAEWTSKGYSNYGLIAMGESGEGAQVEKVTFEQATKLLAGLGTLTAVGPSLGSFSVSAPLLLALMGEFKAELDAKLIALDSDPHFWMPMTLSLPDYIEIMGTKGTSAADATSHYSRIQGVKASLSGPIFGAVSCGTGGYWWDYGQVAFYIDNNMKLVEDSEEARAMRMFFGIPEAAPPSAGCAVKGGSRLMNSVVTSGSVASSVLVGVHTNEAEVEGCMLVNVTAPKITGKDCLVYNLATDEELVLEDGEVRVGMQLPGGNDQLVMKSMFGRDGKKDWKERVLGNQKSYEEVYNANTVADPLQIELAYHARHAATLKNFRN